MTTKRETLRSPNGGPSASRARFHAELDDALATLADIDRAVAIFGSARSALSDPFVQMAEETAYQVGKRGYATITGGGGGIMAAANRGARRAGAMSIGLNIKLPFEQKPNPAVDRLLTFHYFAVRKAIFLECAQAFAFFPGGFGTMDELFEVLVLVQTGKMDRRSIVLVGTDYWTGLINWWKQTVLAEHKILAADLSLVTLVDTPEECIAGLLGSAP